MNEICLELLSSTIIYIIVITYDLIIINKYPRINNEQITREMTMINEILLGIAQIWQLRLKK